MNAREEFERACLAKYKSYQRGAHSRCLSFNINLAMASALFSGACRYCDSTAEDLGERLLGIDRVNNDRGYEASNVVSCCSICNSMKSTLPALIFVNHCTKVFRTHQARAHAEN